MKKLQYKIYFARDITEHNQLDQHYGTGSKTDNHENVMLTGVEMDARKSVKRRDFKYGSSLMMIFDYRCIL